MLTMLQRPATSLASILVASLALGACGDEVATPITDVADRTADQRGPQGSDEAASQAKLSHQLNAVRAATAKYRDLSNAEADGYEVISPYVPGMGFHFSDRTPPFGTDREDPPVLVYFTNGSYNPAPGEALDPDRKDDLVLGAVEYLVPGNQEEDAPNLFADEESPRTLKTTEEEGWHFEEAEGFTGLHAWVHRGNSEGVFHSTNPTVD